MKRNRRAEKKRWQNWRDGFFRKPLEQIRMDYDGKPKEARNA